jgi:cytochrome c peroxidase
MSARWHIILVVGLALAGLGLWWWARDSSQGATPAIAYAPVATDQPVTPIPANPSIDPRKVALGDRLFHDKRLSRDDSIACAGCHDLNSAGQDHRPTALGIAGQLGPVNSPTVFNAALNFRQFWDGRAATLEEQAEGPIHNAIEMDSNWRQVLEKLNRDPAMVADFKAIWPDGLTSANIQRAIAEFERSLLTPDSAFDHYLRGDENAISADAREGWRLFRDLGCSACHQGVNLGGNLYANLGVMGDYFVERGRPIVKADLGRFNVTGNAKDKHVFKVPSLRNVSRTAPYFHDGSVPTLDKAVRAMARYQLGTTLTDAEVNHILAFLESLTGRYRGQSL